MHVWSGGSSGQLGPPPCMTQTTVTASLAQAAAISARSLVSQANRLRR